MCFMLSAVVIAMAKGKRIENFCYHCKRNFGSKNGLDQHTKSVHGNIYDKGWWEMSKMWLNLLDRSGPVESQTTMPRKFQGKNMVMEPW